MDEEFPGVAEASNACVAIRSVPSKSSPATIESGTTVKDDDEYKTNLRLLHGFLDHNK